MLRAQKTTPGVSYETVRMSLLYRSSFSTIAKINEAECSTLRE